MKLLLKLGSEIGKSGVESSTICDARVRGSINKIFNAEVVYDLFEKLKEIYLTKSVSCGSKF